jgi:hypothetical protein
MHNAWALTEYDRNRYRLGASTMVITVLSPVICTAIEGNHWPAGNVIQRVPPITSSIVQLIVLPLFTSFLSTPRRR